MYEKAVEIIERFYGCEEEDEDDSVTPMVAEGSMTFSFGCNTAEITPGKAPSACGLETNNTPGGGGSMALFSSPVRALNFA